MANAGGMHTCCFQWNITNPFLPSRNMEATFYHGSPKATQWKAIIQPTKRRVNFWEFSFSLEYDKTLETYLDIVADAVSINITLNRNTIEERRIFHYAFNQSNRYKYRFETTTTYVLPQTEPHHLKIQVEISLSGPVAGDEERIGFDEDLISLSDNLLELKNNPQYSDMKLLTSGNLATISAHSCIIDARWNNFLEFHHEFDPDYHDTVETNISFNVLDNILTYMYSGKEDSSWSNWSDCLDPSYFAELFQVIDKYKLFHLYKVFVINERTQVRKTINSLYTESRIFPLILAERQINESSYTWHINQNPRYQFIFKIHVMNRNRADPCLSYSLMSRSPSRVFAQVNVELLKILTRANQRNSFRRFRSVHQREYTIEPNASLSSEPFLFLGTPAISGNPNPDKPPRSGRKTRYWFRCILNFSDGSTCFQVLHFDNSLQNTMERFNVLSDHMHKLRRAETEADLRIESPSKYSGYTFLHRVHKAIIAARIPEWQNVFENENQGNDLPDVLRSTFHAEALKYIFEYIYTGKAFNIPHGFLDEIQRFAEQSGIELLENIVRDFRRMDE